MSKIKHLPFFFFVVISIILMTYQSERGPLRPFGFLRYAVYPLDYTIDNLFSSIEGTFERISLREKELASMKKEIDALKLKNNAAEEAQRENQRLKILLSLKDTKSDYLAAAHIIGRGTDRWSNTVIIDKGSSNGIKKDMPVITPDGLAGKIMESYDRYSLVLLINDIKFSASARLQDSRHEAVFSGTGSGRPALKYLPSEETVKQGESVITSGLDLLFPADIPIGKVGRITKKAEGLFQNIEIIPFVNTKKTEDVIVLNNPTYYKGR